MLVSDSQMLKESKNYILVFFTRMVGWGNPNQVSASKHAFEEINVNKQVTVLWILSIEIMVGYYVATEKPANHACPKPNYTLESQNTWGAVQIYCISLLWSWKVMLLVGDPWFLSTIRHRRPTIWRQCTNADSLVIKCLWLCWLVHTSSKWWSNSLYLNPEMFRKSFCSRRALTQPGSSPF